MDGQMNELMEVQMDARRWMDVRTNRSIDGWVDVRMDESTDGWMHELMEVQMDVRIGEWMEGHQGERMEGR